MAEREEKLIKEIIDFLYQGIGVKYNKLNVRIIVEQIVSEYELKKRSK